MKLRPALALTLCLASATQAVAEEDKIKQSVLAFNLAVDRARKDSDACKQAVMTPLKDARDTIQQSATAPALTAARRTVEDLVDGPASACGEPVKKELQRALDRLAEAIAELAPAAPTPTASRGGTTANPDLEAAKKCWNYVNPWTAVDPGCAYSRAGKPPMNRAQFDKLKGAITTAGDRFERTGYIDKLVSEQKVYLTCLQLSTILPLFIEETDKVEMVKQLARGLVDPQNAAILGRHVRNAQAKQDMLQTVAENKEGL